MRFLQIAYLIMLSITVASIATAGTDNASPRGETRCGWFDNPTPANVSLIDRDGEWLIGAQGGYQLKDEHWPWPDFKKSQWVVTNVGGHGYGCACLKVSTDRSTQKITHIYAAHALPLNTCRKDRALKEPH
jgi:hypothetical protein